MKPRKGGQEGLRGPDGLLPIERLQQWQQEEGITVKEMAEALGLEESALHQAYSRKQNPNEQRLIGAARSRLRLDPRWILLGEGNPILGSKAPPAPQLEPALHDAVVGRLARQGFGSRAELDSAVPTGRDMLGFLVEVTKPRAVLASLENSLSTGANYADELTKPRSPAKRRHHDKETSEVLDAIEDRAQQCRVDAREKPQTTTVISFGADYASTLSKKLDARLSNEQWQTIVDLTRPVMWEGGGRRPRRLDRPNR